MGRSARLAVRTRVSLSMLVSSPVGLVRYQQKYQQSARLPTDRRAPPRTGRSDKCRQLLDYSDFSERPRTIANDEVVPLAGLEPARCCHHLILSQARLPIPPQGLDRRDHSGGAQGVNGPIPLPPLRRYMGAEIDGAQRRAGAGGVGMSEMTISMIRSRPVASATIAIAAVGAATILGALILQYGLGLQPCPLCL